MSNPKPPSNLNAAMQLNGLSVVQVVSDTKYSTKTLAAGVAPVSTDFFTSAPNQDPTIDNYDQGNAIVTSAKKFVIQGIGVNVRGAASANGLIDVDNVIQKGVLVLTCQEKQVGKFRLRNLNAAGGTFVAGAQVAAASNIGVTNGLPQASPWQISEMALATNQTFKATLYMPSGTGAVTLNADVTVEVDLFGFEVRPPA